ncbi:MAG: SH3 domain-containing protein [Clostridium sp.]|uniref:SH3 domain-containing protein n=1 Tax=Clostridium sp. TaxID=1506 RepID=UPI003EE7324F
MKKKKAVALVLAASTSATVVLAKNAIIAHADTLNGSKNNIKNENISENKGKVININSNLRIRQGSSSNTPVVGYLQNGDVVNILGEDNGFYKININGVTGYVYNEYIEKLNGSNVKENNSTLGTIVNVRSNLRFRSEPTTDSTVLGYFTNGQEVKIIGQANGWTKVSYEGQVGYVDSSYVGLKNNSNQNAVVNEANNNTVSMSATGGVVHVETNLRIRTGATTDSTIIGRLYEGDKVNIVGKDGDWYKIKTSNGTGFVCADYIEILGSGNNNIVNNNENNNISKTNGYGEVINIPSTLRVRTSPSLSSGVIGSLQSGQTFKITGQSGNWYKIDYNGQSAYVSSNYVKKVDSLNNNNTSNNTQSTSANGTVINISSNLRVRTAPSLNSSVVGYLLNGQNVKVTGKDGNWYRINIGGQTGYVNTAYISLNGTVNDVHDNTPSGNQVNYTNKFGEVINIDSSLRVRGSASLDSSVIGYLLNGQGVKVLGKTGNWYKISFNGQAGYVSSAYIKLVDHLENNSTQSGASFERLYSILKNQIGSPYLWGAEGQYITTASLNRLKQEFPEVAREGRYNIPAKYINHGYRGFDCSGLLDWAFSQMGINIGRTTYQQVNAGRAVSLKNVRPGDLLFFKGPVHVGLYIGNGKWIVAPESHAYVRIENVPWNKIACARRVLP